MPGLEAPKETGASQYLGGVWVKGSTPGGQSQLSHDPRRVSPGPESVEVSPAPSRE